MKNSAEVLMKIEQNRAQIKKFGVRRLGLFGSAARHETASSGDLDFLVEFKNKSFDAYIRFEVLLGRSLPMQNRPGDPRSSETRVETAHSTRGGLRPETLKFFEGYR